MFLAIGWCLYVPGRSTVLHFDDVKLSRIGSVVERKNRRRVYVFGQLGVGILSLFGERSPPAHANFKISALQCRRGSIHCRLCSPSKQHSWKKSKHHCKVRSLCNVPCRQNFMFLLGFATKPILLRMATSLATLVQTHRSHCLVQQLLRVDLLGRLCQKPCAPKNQSPTCLAISSQRLDVSSACHLPSAPFSRLASCCCSRRKACRVQLAALFHHLDAMSKNWNAFFQHCRSHMNWGSCHPAELLTALGRNLKSSCPRPCTPPYRSTGTTNTFCPTIFRLRIVPSRKTVTAQVLSTPPEQRKRHQASASRAN